ncbi:MAG: response regulator [Deltaproteobacteria bacterium]|nr:response regulator [Deltaproteobacteria bacterium]
MALKILIAEDDRHTRRILEHIFTKDPHFADKNIKLFLAPDGEEALKIFEEERPDLVITDLLMPRLDGFALCRAIRKLPQGEDVPLIVTSAIYKETALLNRMRDELHVEFFAKPFQIRELLRGVQRMLEQRGQRPSKAEDQPPKAQPEEPWQGNLSKHSPADLMFEAMETLASGQLILRRGRVTKTVFFVLGSPVAAESNVRNESFSHYLVVKHILDEQQHARLLSVAKRDNATVMQTLVSLGWLSEEDVLRHYTALVKIRIINSLRWSEGTFRFEPGESLAKQVPGCTIDGPTIVLLGLKRVTNPDDVAENLADKRGRPIILTQRGLRYQETFVRVFGDTLLRRISGTRTADDLLNQGLDPLILYTHLNALLQTSMAALGQQREQSRPMAEPIDPLGLEQLKHAATELRTDSQDSQEQVLYRELFGEDEVSVVTNISPVEEQQAGTPEDSQVIEIPISPEIGAIPAKNGVRSAAEARKMVLSAYLDLRQKNYYELLGVGPKADPRAIEQAYQDLMTRFDPAQFLHLDLGTDHPKLEEIVHELSQAYHVLTDPVLRRDYDNRLAQQTRPQSSDPLEGELLFREGEQHLRENRFDLAMESFRQAAETDPEVPDYYAYYAWAAFRSAPDDQRGIVLAMPLLDQAISMDPEAISAHLFLGKIAAARSDTSLTVNHLEHVLEIDPQHEEAFQVVYETLAKQGDWGRLDRLHRKLLQRLEGRSPNRVLALWKSLAALHRDRLQDPEGARTCIEMALTLAPDDPTLVAALNSLSQKPLSWQHERNTVLPTWMENPEDLSPIERLFHRAIETNRYDEAFVTASVAAALASHDQEVLAYHRRYRPRFLQRAQVSIDEGKWRRLRHPGDKENVAAVFSVLADANFAIVQPEDHEPADIEENRDHFGRVLDYLCWVTNAAEPKVSVSADLGDRRATIVSPCDPRILVSPDCFAEQDHRVLAADLALILPMARPGLAIAATMTSQQAKELVSALMLLVAPKIKIKDPNGTIRNRVKQLEGLPEQAKAELRDRLVELTKKNKTLSVSRWIRGVQSTAARATLLLVGDVKPVLDRLPTHPAFRQSLVRFALSDDFLALRDQLGLSVVI